jgi:transposase
MAKRRDEKAEFLKSRGALNQKPNSVQDEMFKDSDFFDSRDLVQVRYEMLRSHFTEGRSVSEVSRSFGLSRQFFYRLANIFKAKGLLGLLPRKRGPKGPHKCFEEILDLAEKIREKKPDADFGEVCQKIEKTQGVHIHPRTLEKALLKRKKNPQ